MLAVVIRSSEKKWLKERLCCTLGNQSVEGLMNVDDEALEKLIVVDEEFSVSLC